MKLPPRLLRFSLALTFGLAILMSCDNPSKPEPTTPEVDGSLVVRGVVEFSDAWGFPDSGVWYTTKILSMDSGRGSIDCSLKDGGKYDCSQSFEIGGVLGSDSLIQDMYAFGLHIGRVAYTQTGSTLLLKSDPAAKLRSMSEWNLLRAFLADFQKTNNGAIKPTRKDLSAYYAKILLAGDSLALANDLPKGMSVDSVNKAIVVLASQQGLTAKALADKNLSTLTPEVIRALTGVLVKAGVPLDTAALYPGSPVRVTQEIKVLSDLTAGGASVAVSGAFEWNAKWPVRKIVALVKTTNGGDDRVVLAFKKPFDSTSGSFVLTGNATLTAKAGAQIGTDTLLVTAIGDSASETGRAVFRVVPPSDSSLPELAIVSPSRDTTVPHSTEKLLVVAQASSAAGIAEVLMGSTRLTKAPYLATVELAVGFNLIVVQAKDSAGKTKIDSVLVTRQKSATASDSIAPAIRLQSPNTDTTVASTLDSIRLEWLVIDNSEVDSVWLDGSLVNGDSSIFRKTVALRTGNNKFTIKARDPQGNQAIRTIEITRVVDPSHPSILAPADQTVAPQDASFKLVWKITSITQVAKISFDSKDVPVDSMVVREVDLKVGANAFTIVVIDTAGKIYTQTVVITRPAEIVLPSIKALNDTTVGADTEAITLNWTITNSAKAKSGVINGDAVEVGPTISKKVKLDPGANTFKLVLVDASGETVSSVVTITRAIDTANLGVSKLSDRSVSPETERDTLTWTVYHADKAVSAMLNDKSISVSETIREVVDLAVGNNAFVLALKDATGNIVADTVVVVRAADTKGPTLTWITPTSSQTVEASVTSFAVQIKATDESGVDSVWLGGALTKKEDGDKYSGTVSLPKPDGNPVKVVVIAKDAKGNITRDSLAITRKVPDNTDKPIIKLLKPSSATGNALPFETTTLHVEADITDELLAVDPKTVTFGGVAAKATGSVYVADVPVLLTGKPQTISIKASNINGTTSTLDIEVTRANDGIKPAILPDTSSTSQTSTKSQTVEYRVKTITLSWKVSDNVGVTGVQLNGQALPVNATVTATLNLAVDDNRAVLVVTDAAGNKDSSVVVITRKPDVTKPVVVITKPSKDTTLAYGTTQLAVTATATDVDGSGIDSVRIGNTKLTSPNSPYTTTVNGLKSGADAIIVKAYDKFGNMAADTVIVTVRGLAATPVFSPAGGTYQAMQKVAITSGTQGAAIHYTLDGSTPTANSTRYTAAFDVGASKTIKAIAVLAGYGNSAVATETYTINYPQAAKPTFSPDGSVTLTGPQLVTISTITENASICYTIGKNPPVPGVVTSATTTCAVGKSLKVEVSLDATIRAIAVGSALTNSSTASATFAIKLPQAAKPTFTPTDATPLAGTQRVTIASETKEAKICYTIGKTPSAPGFATGNGTTCAAGSNVAIDVSLDTTIRAIAVGAAFAPSLEATASFKVKHDTTLANITVDGVTRPVMGTIIDWPVSGLKPSVSVSAKATIDTAVVKIGNPPTTSPISLTEATTSVQIVVTNGPRSLTYTLNLIKADTGSVTDADKQVYHAVKLGTLWWLTENINWGADEKPTVGVCAGATCPNGRKYTGTEATKGRDNGAVCPVGWRLPTAPEWIALTPEQVNKLDANAGAALFWTSTFEDVDKTQLLVGKIGSDDIVSTTPAAVTETEWIRCVK